MRLLELSANKESFHKIVFNPKGISIIAAIKETNDPRKTYNSVGKSLSIAIVHFCLGANLNPEFAAKLYDWEFTLVFQIGSKLYTAIRSVVNPGVVTLNQQVITVGSYKNQLGNELFRIPDDSKYISFRGLISRFIRPKKTSYVSYDTFIAEENNTATTQLLNNGFLLGLDTNRILRKHDLKEQLDKVNDLKKQLNNPDFKSLFQSEKDEDIELTIVDLESKIDKLKSNLNGFQIAEDFNEVRKEADRIVESLRSHKNRASKLNNAIRGIDKSLILKPDISKDAIVKLYQEANVQLGSAIVKRLDELQLFNQRLIENRELNLLDEKRKFEKELSELDRTIKQLGTLKDQKLSYLNSHGALDEYTKMNQVLSDFEKKLEKVSNYKRLLTEYKKKSEVLKMEFREENIATLNYLTEAEPILKKNIRLFRSFSEIFYKDKSSGITVENNDGNNKLRFNIKAKIEDDAGDAVNEVKVFCFDWTLLKGQHNHNVKFIFHDSRITDGLDTRQVKAIFEIAQEECKKGGFQYIISLNQNVIDMLKAEMSEREFIDLVSSNIVLRLGDKSPKDKLLGVQIDLDYEI